MRLAIASVVAIFAVALVSCSTTDPNATSVSEFSGYEAWTKVNAEPITGDRTGTLGRNIHEGEAGFRDVFVNPVGQAVATGAQDGPYPVGTIVVKNSYAGDNGQIGDLSGVTVMVKRDAGYDSENGDWEYVNLSADLDVKGQGLLNGCISCHSAAADRDYIFGGYQ